MKLKKSLIILPFLFCLPLYSEAQETPPDPATLSEITERGRSLVAYDIVAWNATDAVKKLSPDNSALSHYVILKEGETLKAYFGNLEKDYFEIYYVATADKNLKIKNVEKQRPVLKNQGIIFSLIRALETAKNDFKENERPYNVSVFRFSGEEMYVYFVPAPLRPNQWPLGKDVRYKISSDGKKILEKTMLHKDLIELPPPPKGVKAGYHTIVLTDLPTETDVMYVMERKPKVEEFVLSKKFAFNILPDGKILYLGLASKFRSNQDTH